MLTVDDDVVGAKLRADGAACVREEGAWSALAWYEVRTQLPLTMEITPTQLSVLTEVAPFMTSEGIPVAALDQNHTLMKLLVRSTAYLHVYNDEL